MKRYIALLLAIVILLTACGTTQSNGTDPNSETKSTALDNQNGTADTTNETTATTDGSGETNSTEATGGSGTGTTETAPPTDAPTVPSVTPTTTPTTESTVPADYTLKISQSSLTLEAGQIGNLTVEYTGTGTLTWKSSDTSKATVSNGKVTALAATDTPIIITVTDGVRSSQCAVTITKKTESSVEVTLKLSKTNLDLKVGESVTLTATYTGTKSLTWTSNNTAVVTVKNGKVTAVAAGPAVISVSDGVKTVQCTVNVTNPTTPVVVNLTVSPTTLNLVVGNTSTLTASYNGTGTLSWSSNDTSVVTVSNGKVTAKAAGTAKVTVTDGSKSATCDIVVTAPVTLTINTKAFTTVSVGNTLQIDYTYSGDKSELTWSSDDTSILTVNNSGLVTAKAAGSTGVIVTNGSITKVVVITVSDAPKATSIKEWNHNAPLYDGVVKYAGDYMTFEAMAQPDNSNIHVTVTSNNTSVVSVSYEQDYRGITQVTLNFKSAGTATVTITSADGAVSKSYSITVKGDYACNPGKSQLTPEEFAYCCNKVVEANGFTISSYASSYKYITLSDDELTWEKAKQLGQSWVHQWWINGSRYVNVVYQGIDENGNHLFYNHH